MAGGFGRRKLARRLMMALFMLLWVVPSAVAQIGSSRYASIVVDVQSGRVISQANADEFRFPASLTKMMTLYLTFEAIRANRLSLAEPVTFSAWSSSMPPTKLGVPPGGTITVEQAILALVTRSANDAASALGERLGGTEDHFAELMTLRARALGMGQTTFRNASGLPDWGQVTTARDLVVLARHLIQDFPEFYHYFGTPGFLFHGRMILNHQGLLRSYPGADGLKTGYTEASGYNVVTSASRGGVRLIGVVLGAANGWERDLHMASLLDQGFEQMGVAPVEVARLPPPGRLSLFGTAHAASLAPPPPEMVAPPRFTNRNWAAPSPRRVAAAPAPRVRTVPLRPRWARPGVPGVRHSIPSWTAMEWPRRGTRG